MRTGTGLQTKFRGALLGGAIGDALGAPFEGQVQTSREAVLACFEQPGALRYTDDTHMTIGLADSLLACSGFDGEHLASTFARNYAAEPWRGYGSGPPQIFRLLAEGVPWDQAAASLFGGQGSLGNGGAMRVAPAALFAFDDLEQVAWLARQSARVTHSHELGIEGAVLHACAAALLLRQPATQDLDVPQMIDVLYGLVGSSQYCQQLDGILALGEREWEAVAPSLGRDVTALASVPTALTVFLWHRHDYIAVVAAAIALGGDTDTIAAMAGSLSGAYQGASHIPRRWRRVVEGSGQLTELADRLLDRHRQHA
jgi:poly(ADP-ribose) glycohydrolase ARH3